ncbi:Mu transposase domain-containing protein [Gracilibacillus orientalis]|nr:hypothetical protein [Gracilibacillus orientalis]
MAGHEKIAFTALPSYQFDTSKSTTYKVDSFSTIKFDYNYYSVPMDYVDKDVSIKGFGNKVIIVYKLKQIANYPRCYGRGETKYSREHYIDHVVPLMQNQLKAMYPLN